MNLLRWTRGNDGHLVLEVQEDTNNKTQWKKYTQSKNYVADIQITGLRVSRGFATAQKCLREGYKYVSTNQ